MATITIDPITRIEGHLKSQVVVENGAVTDAQLASTMARGMEALLTGKDPRDSTYVTERICGVCFSAHGLASCMAVEKAHGTTAVPDAARLVRNLVAGAAWLHDHVLHFYHLSALDYLDLRAVQSYQGTDTYLLKLKSLIDSELANPPVEGEYAGPFLPNYSYDDPYFVRDAAAVQTLVQHYLEALNMQVKAKKMSALLGGKQPHQSTFVVGGVTQAPGTTTVQTLRTMLAEQVAFIENKYVADVLSLATGALRTLASSSAGVGRSNYLCYGGFPNANGSFLFPEGALVAGALVSSSRTQIEAAITEDVTRSWYAAATGGHPSATTQTFDLNKAEAYTFVKAPRYGASAMEVGPLARMMVALARPEHPAYNHRAVRKFQELLTGGMQPGAVARHAARALETLMVCDSMSAWLTELEALIAKPPVVIHDTAHWAPPISGTGWGLTEAPRGALGHWVRIDNKVTNCYACVVPTTWNASPRSADGARGPMEQALVGCPVADVDNPVNVVRVVRSFDPCMACAVHVLDTRSARERTLTFR